MISLMLALAAGAAPADQDARYKECTALVKTNAKKAVSTASEWRVRGGGILARQCLGLAYVELGQWVSAAAAFEQAARDSETVQDPRRADFWVQSGNAWLAAEQPDKARIAFGNALATTHLTPELRGEVHLDRGRAAVALDDLPGARTDIDKGLELVPRDPFAWYLSSALALKQGQMARAVSDIAKAVELAPDDAAVLLQAGTVAGTTGDVASAKRYYERTVRLSPNSEAGRAAQAALTRNSQPNPEPAESPE